MRSADTSPCPILFDLDVPLTGRTNHIHVCTPPFSNPGIPIFISETVG